MAAPLTSLLKGGRNRKFSGDLSITSGAIEAFETLKAAFTSAPMLRHFDQELKLRLETDASGYAIAGILSQQHPAGNHRSY